MTKHVKFGGSTAARTIQCPQWHRLSEEAPVNLSGGVNEAADQGTLLHNAMEEIFENDEVTAEDVIAKLISEKLDYQSARLTIELANEKLLPAVAAMDELMEKYDITDWMTEPYVEIEPDIAGSIDVLMQSADLKTVVVVDYKMGYVSVSPIDNAQLMFYALAATIDVKTASWFEQAEKIVLVIIQPNEKGADYEEWSISMGAIDVFESKLMAAIAKTFDEDARPISGPACKYCPAMATCPEKTGLALKATRVNEITVNRLAELLPMASELTAWIKEVERVALEQLQLGTSIKGYKLVNKKATRVWNDLPAVESKVKKARSIKTEEAFITKLKTPAQLEKLCADLDIDFDKQYNGYVSKISSGTTIAKESDKRTAAVPVAGLAQLNALNN